MSLVNVHTVRTACLCAGCGRKSRLVRGGAEAAVARAAEAGWTTRLETPKGRRRHRGVCWTENHYCPRCSRKRAAEAQSCG